MGLSVINLHIKTEADLQRKQDITNWFQEEQKNIGEDPVMASLKAVMIQMQAPEADELPDASDETFYIDQNDFLTIVSDKIHLGNYKELACQLSRTFDVPVLTTLVYNSDVAVIAGFEKGRCVLEEVRSSHQKKPMDRGLFRKLFCHHVAEDVLCKILDQDMPAFAESIFTRLSELLSIDLLLLPEDIDPCKIHQLFPQ